jgi:bifunctional DNA-binding transcriptional regulator/antitoxin component of YhaV-PrlF toxin-antitoxin module
VCGDGRGLPFQTRRGPASVQRVGEWSIPSEVFYRNGAAVGHIVGYLTIDQKGRTTLPQEMRKQLGITAGVQLRIEQADNGAFDLVPTMSIPQDQLFYHSLEGRARLERAEEDVRLGRVTRTDSPEEAQAFLDSLKSSRRSDSPSAR